MSIESELEQMYAKRYDRREIKRPPSGSTLYQHKNNITKLHTAITGNDAQLFGQMKWIDEKSGAELLDIVKTLKGRKGDTLGVAAQRSYLSSILVAIRVINFYKGQETPLFQEVMDLLQVPLKKEIEAYREQLKQETKESLPEYSEVIKLTENFINTDQGDLDMKILLRIYTIYPIRLEAADLIYIQDHAEYRKMKKNELTKNYVVIGKKKILFSFSDYKTSLKYGTVEFQIKDKLLKKLLQEKALKTLSEFRRHSLDTQMKFYVH